MIHPLQPMRRLGMTGITVPLIGYGTAPLGKSHVTREHAVRCLNRAIDLGITYIDTSPDYGSEPHVGEVMRARRDEVFLASKVNRRTADGALEEVRQSLERLQTSHLDLVQVHAINAWADLEQALAPDGAVTGLEEARQRGWVRFIGITGHARPEILAHGIAEYPFDTVLAALGMADHLVANPERFLLPEAKETSTGVIAMKVYGHGCFQHRELALYYTLGLPNVSMALIGLDNERQVEEVVQLAHGFRHLGEGEEEVLIDEVRELLVQDTHEARESSGMLFWLHDTAVMGWLRDEEPVMVRY